MKCGCCGVDVDPDDNGAWCSICGKMRCADDVRETSLPGDQEGYNVCRACRDLAVANGWIHPSEITNDFQPRGKQ